MPNSLNDIGTYYSGVNDKCWRCHSTINEGEMFLFTCNTKYCKKCGIKIVEKAKETHKIMLDTMLAELRRD